MKHPIYFAAITLVAIMFGTQQTIRAATVAERLAGYFLIQVEKNGEGWYVYPKSLTRYYLGRPTDAFDVMKRLGVGISNANLAKIPIAGSPAQGDIALRNRLSGYILLQVEKNGEGWYVYPKTKQRYALGRPSQAFTVMKQLAVGITNANLAQIPADVGIIQSTKGIVTTRGTFSVEMLRFDRANPALKIKTDTASTSDCHNNCPVLPLASYVSRRAGTAGIHGTYFCPPDYASCSGQINYYYFPVYNSFSRVMINAGRIKYTSEPIVLFDTSNRPFFVKETKSFTSYQDLLNEFAVMSRNAGGSGQLQAAISNGPPLIINGQNVVNQYQLDAKQATVKSYRGAIGWKGDTIYLMVVRSATVTDSATVMKTLGLDYAINLDGGGSTAFYNAGRYVIGPGRSLPNAIIVTTS